MRVSIFDVRLNLIAQFADSKYVFKSTSVFWRKSFQKLHHQLLEQLEFGGIHFYSKNLITIVSVFWASI